MKLIFRYIRRHLLLFLTAVSFLTLETVAELLQPTFMSLIVDEGVQNQDVGRILQYGLIMLGIAALGALGAVMRNIYASRTSQLISKELRSDLYRRVQSLSFENIERLSPASLITRITNDVTQIQNFVNGIMRIMMKVPILCVGSVILIIVQTPRQFPVMAAILLICAVLIAANMRLGYPRFGALQRRLDRLNDVCREFLSSVRVVKAFCAEDQEAARFSEAAAGFAGAGVSAVRVLAVFSPLINLTVNAGIVLLLWLSQAQNAGEIGRLMASVNYMTQVLFALGMISNILNSAVRAAASAQRLDEILEEQPAQRDGAHAAPAGGFQGSIRFEDLSFTYAGCPRPALEHLSFSVAPGETVGIIGPTGSGKSTLVSLVPRFYDPTRGRLLIDGTDVTRLSLDALRDAVAVVPQKALLFSGTIADNLRWGNKHATAEELEAALHTASASFVRDLPEGLSTFLGQGGVNLSGGQKQRLSLARALLKNPRILILDDCTSALDASTEAQVLGALQKDLSSRTVLLISQKISTVMRADRILCLEDGKLAGFGTHRELLASCPAYQAIYHSQIGGEIHA